MPISPECLPSELHYIIPLAELHGTDARKSQYDRTLGRHVQYAERVSADEIEPLRQLYAEIQANDHGPLINRWHHKHSVKGMCPAETTWPVYGLLCLFARRGERGLAPFNDGAVGPMEFPAELDWNKLPPDLKYLAGPAARYGELQFQIGLRPSSSGKRPMRTGEPCGRSSRWCSEMRAQSTLGSIS